MVRPYLPFARFSFVSEGRQTHWSPIHRGRVPNVNKTWISGIEYLVRSGDKRIDEGRGRPLRHRGFTETVPHFFPGCSIVRRSQLVGWRMSIDRRRGLRYLVFAFSAPLHLFVQAFEVRRTIPADFDIHADLGLIRFRRFRVRLIRVRWIGRLLLLIRGRRIPRQRDLRREQERYDQSRARNSCHDYPTCKGP